MDNERKTYPEYNQPTIRVLFLAANPHETTRLQIDEEMRAIDQALRTSEYHDRFDLHVHGAVHYGDLQELLLRHQPHIVHFSGHGSMDAEIILQSDSGLHPVSAEALSVLFSILKDNLRCVILNACYSVVQAEAIANHIDCVIGMTDAIADRASISFAVAFYRALGYGRSVKEAFDLGCNELNLANLSDRAVPRLLTVQRDPAQILFANSGTVEVMGNTEPVTDEAPYKGLDAFDISDANIFFGREKLTSELVTHLRQYRFLAVVGASGSGKSSVVLAGLVPALQQGEALADGVVPPDDSRHWLVCVMKPTARPLKALAVKLTQDEPDRVTLAVMDDLARDARILDVRASKLLVQSPKSNTLLLIVDQFEELFTLCKDKVERKAFLDNLLTAVEIGSSVTVVITLRADFYAECAEYDHLRNALESCQRFIGPMTQDELRRAIEEPARLGEWEFEPGLVDLMLEEMGDEPGALPLLSHALLETWQHRRARTLTFAGFQAVGRVKGAIAETANRVYTTFSPRQQQIARNIFIRLTELGEGVRDTRRRVTLDELSPNRDEREEVGIVLNTLAKARLITMFQEQAEVAHEALIHEWPILRRWLDENREWLQIHRRLTEAAQDWADQASAPDLLYQQTTLEQTLDKVNGHETELNELEQNFLEASREAMLKFRQEKEAARQRELDLERERALAAEGKIQEQIRARKYLQRLVLALLALVTLILGGSLYINRQAGQLEIALAEAQARVLINQGKQLFEEKPLLGLRLALEGLALVSEDAQGIRQSLTEEVRELAGKGRLLYWRGAIKYAPDNAYFVTYGDSTFAGLWQTQSGELLATLEGKVTTVEWSPDGTRFVVRYADAPDELRQGRDGAIISILPQKEVVVVWAPNGSNFVVGYADSTGELRKSSDGALVTTFADGVRAASWSPDGTRFVVYYSSAPYELRQSSNGTLITTLENEGSRRFTMAGEVGVVDWSPDGTRFLVSYFNAPGELRESDDGTLLVTLAEKVTEVDWSPDGTRFLVDYFNAPEELRASNDGTLLVTLAEKVMEVEWSPDGTRFWVNYFGTAGELRQSQDGSVVANFDAMVRSPDWSRYVISNAAAPGELRQGKDATSITTLTSRVTSSFFEAAVKWAPDGSRFVVHYADNTRSELRQSTDGTVLATLPQGVSAVDWSPDGTRFVVHYTFDPGELRQGEDGTLLSTLAREVAEVYWSPDGANFVVGYDARFVVDHNDVFGDLRQSNDGTLLKKLNGAVAAVHWLAHGGYFVVAYANGRSEIGRTSRRWENWAIDLDMGLEVSPHSFDGVGRHLPLYYQDGRRYLLDIEWLNAMGPNLNNLSPQEIEQIFCDGPLALKVFDQYEQEFQEHLQGRAPRTCQQNIQASNTN